MSRSVLPLRVAVLLVLAAASWGLGAVISKHAVAEIPPLTLLVVQLATSVIALSLAALVARRRAGTHGAATATAAATAGLATSGATSTDPQSLDRLGLLNPGVSYALSLVGLSQITASLSVLIWAVEPVLILVLAWWWLRERVTRRLVALSLAAAGGMALLVWAPGAGGQTFGVAVTLAGVACCAVYTVLTRRQLAEATSTVRVVLGQQAWALGLAVVLLAAAAALDAAGWPAELPGGPIADAAVIGLSPISAEAWLGAVVSGVVYYALAYGFYLAALREVPASLAASAFYLIPVFGVAGGWILLGERLGPVQWLGASVVLVGVVGIARVASSETAGKPSVVSRA